MVDKTFVAYKPPQELTEEAKKEIKENQETPYKISEIYHIQASAFSQVGQGTETYNNDIELTEKILVKTIYCTCYSTNNNTIVRLYMQDMTNPIWQTYLLADTPQTVVIHFNHPVILGKDTIVRCSHNCAIGQWTYARWGINGHKLLW